MMLVQTMDMSTFPREQTYVCDDGETVYMRDLLLSHKSVLDTMAEIGLIKENDSFGFAMLEPMAGDVDWPVEHWDQPEQYVWFAGGWGPDRERYIANAVRKLRPLVRQVDGDIEELGTLGMRVNGSDDFFRDVVESQEPDGSFAWGDFPWGGATLVPYGNDVGTNGLILAGACSAFTEIEDDTVTKLVLGAVAKPILLGMGTNDD